MLQNRHLVTCFVRLHDFYSDITYKKLMPCSQLVTGQHWKASRVFNKILSRSQKLCSRWGRKKLMGKTPLERAKGASFWKNFEI